MRPNSPPPPEGAPVGPFPRRVKVLFCGYGHLGLAILRGLLQQPTLCEVVGVFRWSSRIGTEGLWDPEETEIQTLNRQYDLREVRCKGLNSYEFTQLLEELTPDVLLVGSWGEIIKPHVLEYPNLLPVNCHPSKLPGHRGANPYASVILQGESETGVTFHRIVAGIDAGDILLQQTVPLDGEETGATVREKCAQAAGEMMPALVASLHAHVIDGKPLVQTPQNAAAQSYYPQLKAEDGELQWHTPDDAMFTRMRAFYPWIASYAWLNSKTRLMFYNPNFTDRPAHLPVQPSGTILRYEKGLLQIAMASPERMLEVSFFQLGGEKNLWPLWWGKLLAPFLLKPGRRFQSHPFQSHLGKDASVS